MKEYTLRELSEATGFAVATIRKHIKDGKLQAQKVKGKYVITEEEARRAYGQRMKVEAKSDKTKESISFEQRALDVELQKLTDALENLKKGYDSLQKRVKRLEEDIQLLTLVQTTSTKEEDTRGLFRRIGDYLFGKPEKEGNS